MHRAFNFYTHPSPSPPPVWSLSVGHGPKTERPKLKPKKQQGRLTLTHAQLQCEKPDMNYVR